MSWRDAAACHPNNWPALERKYGEHVREQWWMPNTPDIGVVLLEKGTRVCKADCGVMLECDAYEQAHHSSPLDGVWGGTIRGTGR